MTAKTTVRHRTVPISETITRVGRGYPDKLVIYKQAASRFWWVRYFTQGRVAKRTTKTTDKNKALAFAKKFYEDILLRERDLLPVALSPTFERIAYQVLEEQEVAIAQKLRNPKLNLNNRQILEKDMLPFFRGFNVKEIGHRQIVSYLARLNERQLAPSTLKVHLSLLRKILAVAQRDGLLDHLPSLPKIKLQDSPRGWFTADQYEKLRKAASTLAKERTVVRYRTITDEIRHLITFMVNTFLRPSDIRFLKHRNIEVVKGEHSYLRIQTHIDTPKTNNAPIVTMEAAVAIYESLIKAHIKTGLPVGSDNYLFFPDLVNRDHAMKMIQVQFNSVLERADLKVSASGEKRTLYSLRHTAIMFRLTKGSIDLLTLAKNARTSVEMIERFYARHLQPEMNIDKIQYIRPSKAEVQPQQG
jgi:hypothetical protein